MPIATLNDLTPGDAELVGGLFVLAAQLMKQMGHADYRTVFNCGAGAQERCFTCISCAGRPAVHLATRLISL